MRGIQNDHERSEREKEKVKAEVERLNKVVGSSSSTGPVMIKEPTIRKTATGPLSAADQKKQWSQLADMGIRVPGDFRAEMALPGEWQKVAERPVEDSIMGETLSTGVRKRKYEGQDEEEEAGETIARRGWGSTTRRYPGEEQPDLDDLLSASVTKREKKPTTKVKPELAQEAVTPSVGSKSITKIESNTETEDSERQQDTASIPEEVDQRKLIKDESVESDKIPPLHVASEPIDFPVFKKRKAKAK